jgi:hypothetical protein
MIHTSYKEVVKLAETADLGLTASMFGPSNLVFIIHEEGTTLTFRNAFIKEFKDYLMIFTEHHGTHVYHRGDLSHWGQYIQKEDETLKNTGYMDTCEFCGKEAKTEDLIYDLHPVWCKQEQDRNYHSYCLDCKYMEHCEHKDLWRSLNKTGSYNQEKNCQEPWGFTWGMDDIEHLKKACATIMDEDKVEEWLDTVSPAFPETPRKAFDDGDDEKVYLMVYEVGVGSFS